MAKRPRVKTTVLIGPNVADMDDLREMVPWLREELIKEVRKISRQEAITQARHKQSVSSIFLGKVEYKSQKGELDQSTVYNIIKRAEYRVRLRYQGNLDLLKKIVKDTWSLIDQASPKGKSPTSDFKTFYFRGWTKAGGHTPQMHSLAAALKWIDKQTDPLTSIRIEGPQTPWRRRYIYLDANKGYRSGKRKGMKRTERLKGIFDKKENKVIFDRRTSDFNPNASYKLRLIPGRHRERYEAYAYKAYLKVIAQKMKRKYRGMWIGYRFVPSYEGLIEYPSSTGPRAWGEHLPQIYIGLNPARISDG